MLKVAFPHMGNLYIPLKALLSELGVEPIVPPLTSASTISLGTKHAPEFACFPLKVTLGNLIESIEAGAEAVLMAGGTGPCRLGYYGEVHKEILQEAGYQAEFIILEAPCGSFQILKKRLEKLIPNKRLNRILKGLNIFWVKAAAIDTFDRFANQIRAYEVKKGITSLIQDRFHQQVDNAASIVDVKLVLKDAILALENIKSNVVDGFIPKVLIAGEIFMVLEPRVNFDIERLLGGMGIEVIRAHYITDWIKHHLYPKLLSTKFHRFNQQLASPYLGGPVGGHGLETIAKTVEAGINDFQGVIQLAPFTCMPEIIAMQALPAVSKNYSIPYLSVIIDEHSAETGILTRLEAFVDLIKHHQYQKEKNRANFLEVMFETVR